LNRIRLIEFVYSLSKTLDQVLLRLLVTFLTMDVVLLNFAILGLAEKTPSQDFLTAVNVVITVPLVMFSAFIVRFVIEVGGFSSGGGSGGD